MGTESMGTGTSEPPKLPPPWFIHLFWRAHRVLNRLSGGRFLWLPGGKRGWGAMRVTTTGRRSGRDRDVILGYIEDGADLVVVAMNGWDEGHPAWWLNLGAHPDALVRRKGHDPRRYRAHRATGEERDRLWRRWMEIEPASDLYAARRTTDTPVVVFEPVAAPT